MAIVVRYFSTTGAGTEDGTTWADRAPFISGGAYSTILTGFDFNSADSLECRLGPGTYTVPATLATAVFSVAAPRPDYPLVIHGCDSSGDRLIPDLSWNCAQGTFDSSLFPILVCGTSYQINLQNLTLRCVAFEGSVNNTIALTNAGSHYDWVVGTNTRASAGEVINVDGNSLVTNSYFYHTNATHGRIVRNNGPLVNVRLKGNPSATSGERLGIGTIATGLWQNCRGPVCILDCIGGGVTSAAGYILTNATIYNCGHGVSHSQAAGQANTGAFKLHVSRNFIANVTTGISSSNPGPAAMIQHNRVRATTAYSLPDNTFYADNDTAAGNDTDEFVDAANGDLRIKNTSTYWGKGYGAGDQPASGGTSRPTNPFYQGVIG